MDQKLKNLLSKTKGPKDGKTDGKLEPKKKTGPKEPLLGDDSDPASSAVTRLAEIQVPAEAPKSDKDNSDAEEQPQGENPASLWDEHSETEGKDTNSIPPPAAFNLDAVFEGLTLEKGQSQPPPPRARPFQDQEAGADPASEPKESQPDVSTIVDAVVARLGDTIKDAVESAVAPLRAEIDKLKGQLGGLATKDDLEEAKGELGEAFDTEIHEILGMDKKDAETEAADAFPAIVKKHALAATNAQMAALADGLQSVRAELYGEPKADGAEADTEEKPGLVEDLRELEQFTGTLCGALEIPLGSYDLEAGTFEAAEGLAEIRIEATKRLTIQALMNEDQAQARAGVNQIAGKYSLEVVTQLMQEFVEEPQIVMVELARLCEVTPDELKTPNTSEAAQARKWIEEMVPRIVTNAKALTEGDA